MTPLRQLPRNPHYLEFRGRPAVLVTSGEHYGSVLNLDFDYKRYLDALAAQGFNLTRLFSGTYREIPGAFGIMNNTLAPAPGRYCCPWLQVVGHPVGEKWDLTKFNPQYFDRLRDFMGEASRRSVAVEMVLFCFWYWDDLWKICPMHPAHNINGLGAGVDGLPLPRQRVYDLANRELTAAQENVAREIVKALNEFDNVYYEIANENYSYHDHTLDLEWQKHIADVIVETESRLPNRHFVAMNFQNRAMRVTESHPALGVINFHYAERDAVAWNYHLNRVIADDETGFKGHTPTPYRREAWEFMLSGGGIFSHLDYTYTCACPDGSAPIDAETPGYGGPEMRRQLAALKNFLESLDFAAMAPHNEVVTFEQAHAARSTVLAEPGRQYAVYIFGGGPNLNLGLGLPPGRYAAEWINPPDGHIIRAENLERRDLNEGFRLTSPLFSEDIALKVLRQA